MRWSSNWYAVLYGATYDGDVLEFGMCDATRCPDMSGGDRWRFYVSKDDLARRGYEVFSSVSEDADRYISMCRGPWVAQARSKFRQFALNVISEASGKERADGM